MTENRSIEMEQSWLQRVRGCFADERMVGLRTFLLQEKSKGKCVVPLGKDIFRAFQETPFDKVKVVIVGQDPYHGPNQAHGLAFSVMAGISPPPSLVNIFKEVSHDLGREPQTKGDLTAWARQGVLLLNSVLTVELRRPASHAGQGWEWFTDQVIDALNQERSHLVFLLWGAYAQRKGAGIDQQRHLVLQAPHPSPLSAHRGFFGCRHFSSSNDYLKAHGMEPIQW